MPPHQFGAHTPDPHAPHPHSIVRHHLVRANTPPPAPAPLRNAEALGLWHEPPRIRRRRARWPDLAAFAVIVACLGLFAWTHAAHRLQPDAVVIGRVGQ